MSVLYRALWQAPTDQAIETASEEFGVWVGSKHSGIEVPDVGEAEGEGVSVEVRRGDDDAGSIARWILREERDASRWVTTLTCICARDGGEPWFWVDVDNVSHDYLESVTVSAPRLVRSLINRLGRSHRGNQALVGSPVQLRPDDLQGFLTELEDPDRELPVVVFAYDSRVGLDMSNDRADKAAQILAGLCRVYVLGSLGNEEFRRQVGPQLAVWGGAARVYLPGVDPTNPSPYRHKYFLAQTFGHSRRKPGLLIADYLDRLLTRQRPPPEYFRLRPLIDTADFSSFEELWTEFEEVTAERDRLKEQEFASAAERDDLEERIDQFQLESHRFWTAARQTGAEADLVALLTESAEVVDDVRFSLPATCEEAIDLARRELRRIAIPDDALRDLEVIDQSLESRSWVRGIWKGLVALDEYAAVAPDFNGDFWIWCETSGDEWAWPATDKKLSMTESKDVQSNKRLREMRVLPVAKAVDPAGKTLMYAHLKIAQGGGNNIPRVYFHDDTKGETGKVHIGLLGPHYLVKNRSG